MTDAWVTPEAHPASNELATTLIGVRSLGREIGAGCNRLEHDVQTAGYAPDVGFSERHRPRR
jgi:hypothetical protein